MTLLPRKSPPLLLAAMLAALVSGCATPPPAATSATTSSAAVAQTGVIEGRLQLKSSNGKTLTVDTGTAAEPKLITVRYDAKSKGVGQVFNGYPVKVTYETRADGMPYVIEATPKLAALPTGATEIKTAELKSLVDSRAAFTLIDARPADRHAQGHLPGALSIPEAALKEKGAALLPADKGRQLVFYCADPACAQSTNSAALAQAAGYGNVRVYLEGEAAWTKAGHPLHASQKYVAEGDIVLIDLREAKQAEAGRIPRAVSIPFAGIEKAVDNLPKKAAYVLYGASEEQANTAASTLRTEGIRRVALVAGGFDGWVKGGGAVAKGPVNSSVAWQRKPAKNELARADFEKALAGQDPNAVIIDVRAAHELSAGKLPSALSVPMDELDRKLDLLPKGKKLYAICPTGTRGAIVAGELRKKGYDAYFLNADVECKGDKCNFSNF